MDDIDDDIYIDAFDDTDDIGGIDEIDDGDVIFILMI